MNESKINCSGRYPEPSIVLVLKVTEPNMLRPLAEQSLGLTICSLLEPWTVSVNYRSPQWYVLMVHVNDTAFLGDGHRSSVSAWDALSVRSESGR